MMQTNITVSNALRARGCPYRTRVAPYVLSGLVLLTSAPLALVAHRDGTREHLAIHQGLITPLPAAPGATHAVLWMPHAGAARCRAGAIDAGRAKLQDAAQQLELHANRVTPPQR
jgi:hypothetical protein